MQQKQLILLSNCNQNKVLLRKLRGYSNDVQIDLKMQTIVYIQKDKNLLPLAEQLAEPIKEDSTIILWWLGQAGFAIRFRELLILIDPYLSDFLANKYQGTDKPQDRLIPPPIRADELKNVTAVFCTHRHSDHMDPESLPIIAKNNPTAWFILPRAEKDHALRLGIPEPQIRFVNAGEEFSYSDSISVQAIPASHETLESNQAGEHRFLGYIFSFRDINLYHSGDCISYFGLAEILGANNVMVALLPVNGRDERRKTLGIPGNFTIKEALELCQQAQVTHFIPHHFGMFAFNTVEQNEIKKISPEYRNIQTIIPEIAQPIAFKPA